MRIGFGYDIHKLVPGRDLMIGGVVVPHNLGEEGHSDGDVLIHALIDALLGALSLGDIGTHFPPGDLQYKNISSRILLQKTKELVMDKGRTIINCDCTVVLERPKLAPHIVQIKKLIAEDLCINESDVSVKAKTKEGLDATGSGFAIEAYAVVLLKTV
jgi:2-C-methyl-D-erythritol 2,4-cyclodiphosphate synthase